MSDTPSADDAAAPSPPVATAPPAAAAETAPAAAETPGSGTGLHPEVRALIEALRPRYPTSEALLLPALHAAQRLAGGWLPDAVIAAVAAALDLPAAKVYGVVTFYDLYHQHPVGRHRVRVCTNLSCMLRGAEELLEAVKDELGGVDEDTVTPDGRCSYVHFECLGSCDTAPMMMVDQQYHENLTPETARAIVRSLA